MAVGESLSVGTPVVVTNQTDWEVEEYNCGIKIIPDFEHLKKAIQIMLKKSNHELIEMGINGKKLINKMYSPKKFNDKINNIISEVQKMIKIFSDGANKKEILEMNQNSFISGFTTNPSLMRKAGITNYEYFSKDILNHIKDKPISFEIFADDMDEMERQALKISSWGDNVYVKIPITNTKRVSTAPLIKLSYLNVKLNITAIMTLEQVEDVANSLKIGNSSFISIFCRHDCRYWTGDPIPVMQSALELLQPNPNAELLWASPREVLNVYQRRLLMPHHYATNDLLKKNSYLKVKNLSDYSQETVQMFFNDAQAAGYKL